MEFLREYWPQLVTYVALEMGIPLRWGGDWDNDTQLSNNKFDDLVHFELK